MTVLAFVLLLGIPVALLAKRNALTVLLAVVFGLFIGMTPMGPPLAHGLNNLGSTVVSAFSSASGAAAHSGGGRQ